MPDPLALSKPGPIGESGGGLNGAAAAGRPGDGRFGEGAAARRGRRGRSSRRRQGHAPAAPASASRRACEARGDLARCSRAHPDRSTGPVFPPRVCLLNVLIFRSVALAADLDRLGLELGCNGRPAAESARRDRAGPPSAASPFGPKAARRRSSAAPARRCRTDPARKPQIGMKTVGRRPQGVRVDHRLGGRCASATIAAPGASRRVFRRDHVDSDVSGSMRRHLPRSPAARRASGCRRSGRNSAQDAPCRACRAWRDRSACGRRPRPRPRPPDPERVLFQRAAVGDFQRRLRSGCSCARLVCVPRISRATATSSGGRQSGRLIQAVRSAPLRLEPGRITASPSRTMGLHPAPADRLAVQNPSPDRGDCPSKPQFRMLRRVARPAASFARCFCAPTKSPPANSLR